MIGYVEVYSAFCVALCIALFRSGTDEAGSSEDRPFQDELGVCQGFSDMLGMGCLRSFLYCGIHPLDAYTQKI